MSLPMMPPEKAAAVREIILRLREVDITIRDLFFDPTTLATDERVTMIRRAHHHQPANLRNSSHDAIGMLLDYIDKQYAVIESQRKVVARQSERIRLLDNLDDL
jgi:hypothetical protein